MRVSLAVLMIVAGSSAWAGEPVPSGEMSVPDNKWTKVAEVPADPLGRELDPGRGAFLCFEPAGGVLLRYGGYTPTEGNDLWSFDLARRKWENPLKVDYAWPPPADRPGAGAWWSMAWDAKRKVIWLVGGSGVAGRIHGALFNDIWQYDPAKKAFTAMKAKGFPNYSGGCRIVYDSKSDVVVRAPAYDGEWGAMCNRDTTWVYDPNKNAWEGRKTPGGPKNALAAALVFEPNAGKTVYVKHVGEAGPAETWTFDAAANKWEKLGSKENPPGAVVPGACYDPDSKLVILYGGVGGAKGGYGYLYRGGGVQLDETWALDLAKGEWRKLDVGAPVIAKLPGENGRRFELVCAMDYDAKNKAVVLTASTVGVWALRVRAEGAPAAPELKLAALPAPEKVEPPKDPVFKTAEPNKKLLDLAPETWVKLGGGGCVGGGEVPWSYDEATGFCLKYGGCNNGGAGTFASGYGNDLSAYDPATERWIALRWVDPCGPPRPPNGCTRSYTYDPVRKVNWFQGGTSGNGLASSLPPGFSGGGTWRYDGLKDRFDLVPSTGKGAGMGVLNCYDRANNLIIIPPKAAWADPKVTVFDPVKSVWTQGAATRACEYTYGCYVDSLKGLFAVDPGKDGPKTLLYDAVAGAWKDLAPKGDPLPGGRPTTAYDPEADAVLCLLGGKTMVYIVKENVWKTLETKTPTPKVGEMLVFDRRHKVFLATGAMGCEVWAFRLKK